MYYKNELLALKKSGRFRKRKLYSNSLIDIASNDYLGLSTKKKIFKKTLKRINNTKCFSPKSSVLVNGYHQIHKNFEKKLSKINKFESGIVVGSGFLANIALIESMVRKQDILFIDEDYHASGILASSLVQGSVVFFKHNDYKDLEEKIINSNCKKRIIIAIEGVYSMSGDIAPMELSLVANKYNALMIVDEAHSSGVIGKNLLGWFDYWNITPKQNHIKMGTLGKAYGSYGAYILASKHIISFLENRGKPIIYSTAPSLFDISYAHESLNYIIKNKKKIYKKIKKYQNIIFKELNISIKALIAPIEIDDNNKVIQMQKNFLKKGFVVGAIRQPTVPKAIIRLIVKLDISEDNIQKACKLMQSKI